MINADRVHKCIIAGRECHLLFNLGALRRLEDRLDKSIIKLVMDAQEGGLRIGHLVEILHEGLKGGGDALPVQDVERLIENDFVNAFTEALVAVNNSLGTDNDNKEAEPSSEGDAPKE